MPPPRLTVSQWADTARMLSAEASAEPGQWQTSRAEYLRGVMDAVSDPSIHTIVCAKASQVGWTEILLNVLGYQIACDPGPLLLVQPTQEAAIGWSKERFSPMLRDSPSLHGKVADAKSRDGDNTILQKMFPGGYIAIVGANAPTGLAMRPIRIVLGDEVDRWPASAGGKAGEGDPQRLVARRQNNFWNRKTLLGSTPVHKNTSRIWREFEGSDQRRYFVPCPHCRHPQYLRWAQVKWQKILGDGEILYEVGEGDRREVIEHAHDTAAYQCEACGELWSDVERWSAIRDAAKNGGGWRATKPTRGIAGFHIPGFLSSWLSLSMIVKEFLDTKGMPELLQVWTNTVLGEPWEETGERVEGADFLTRTETYDGDTLPDDVVAITVGVDTQPDRLEAQFIAWGHGEESWPFAYEVFHGDPSQPAVWKGLDEALTARFFTSSGRIVRVGATCIDTGGHHAAQVYAFCRQRKLRRVFPIKGAAGPRPIWPRTASRAGEKGNDRVFIIGVDTIKDALFGRLQIKSPGPGFVHFPTGEGFDASYFEQLTSEEAVTRYREGRPYRVWVKPKGKRNEALDTFVYAIAARRALPAKMDRKIEQELVIPREETPAPDASVDATPTEPLRPDPVPMQKSNSPMVRVERQGGARTFRPPNMGGVDDPYL